MDDEKIAFLRSLPSIKHRTNARTFDEMLGICEGIIADKSVVDDEAKFLLQWLKKARNQIDDPMTEILTNRITDMLADGILDDEEKHELLDILKKLTGDPSLSYKKPTDLPLNNPPPPVDHPGKIFVFTGLMAFASRAECMKIVEDLGGINSKNVTLDTSFLVIGSIASEFWRHSTHGTKILKAMDYRDNRKLDIAIINEDHWLKQALN